LERVYLLVLEITNIKIVFGLNFIRNALKYLMLINSSLVTFKFFPVLRPRNMQHRDKNLNAVGNNNRS